MQGHSLARPHRRKLHCWGILGINPTLNRRRFYRIDNDCPKDRSSWLCDCVLHVESVLPWLCLWVCQLSIHCIVLWAPTLTTLRWAIVGPSLTSSASLKCHKHSFWKAQLFWSLSGATRTKTRLLKFVWKMFVYVILFTNAPFLRCFSATMSILLEPSVILFSHL